MKLVLHPTYNVQVILLLSVDVLEITPWNWVWICKCAQDTILPNGVNKEIWLTLISLSGVKTIPDYGSNIARVQYH
jgi:hypothetical protein